MALVGLLRSRAALEAEVLILRHQLNVLRRKRPKRVVLSNIDRVVFAGLYRSAPGVAGFRAYWRRKSTWGSPHTPRVNCIARQLTEAYGWTAAPRYIIRDRDAVYGDIFIRRLRAMGIRDRPTAAESPWQNGYVERLIGSIRRDCLDNVIVLGERHLRHLLKSYQSYYNEVRTHLSLSKDAPVSRAVQAVGDIIAKPTLGGLHHQYVRI